MWFDCSNTCIVIVLTSVSIFRCGAAVTQMENAVCEDRLNEETSDMPLVANNITNGNVTDDLLLHETTLTELRQKDDLHGASQLAVTTPLSCHAKTFLEIAYGDFCAARNGSQESDDDDDESDKDVTSVARRIVCVEKTLLRHHHTPASAQHSVPTVQLFNSSQLLSHLGSRANSSILGRCSVVLFYAPWCTFCVRLAAHYNALARAFPTLDIVAIDAYHFSR